MKIPSKLYSLLGRGLMTIAVSFSLLPCAHSQDAGEGFMAGTAVVDVTPDVFPIRLRSGTTDKVHDPLHVRAMAFQNGDGRAVIALIDMISSSREYTDEAKARAAEATGWSPSEMMISATHTHTAPKTSGDTPGDIAFREKLIAGMAQAITDAVKSLQLAKVGFGSDAVPEEVYNRRWFLKEGTMPLNPFGGLDKVKMNPNPGDILKPAGPTDPEVCVLDVRTHRGRPLGLLANYSLHYVGGIPAREASADYYGEFARIMPHRLGGSNPPEDFVAMMTNGASGDINNIDFDRTRAPRAPFEQCRVVATKAADAAWRATRDLEYADSPVVGMLERKVVLKLRSVSSEDVRKAEEMLGLTREEKKSLPIKAEQYARGTLRFQEPDQTEEVLIQAIRIGDQGIVSLPFEVLVDIGLEIKEESPFPHTFVISHANGGYGYLPTPEQHELGGYETWIGTNRVEKDSSVILTRQLLEMLNQLSAM